MFSKNEADLAALNREFVPYYQAAAQAKGFSIPPSNMPSDNGGWMVQAMFFSMGTKHDYRAVLKSVTAPVLVIQELRKRDLESPSTVVYTPGKFDFTVKNGAN